MEQIEEIDEIEYCVICDESTKFKKSHHIDYRYGYIEGVGQLCFKCHPITQKIHKQEFYDI